MKKPWILGLIIIVIVLAILCWMKLIPPLDPNQVMHNTLAGVTEVRVINVVSLEKERIIRLSGDNAQTFVNHLQVEAGSMIPSMPEYIFTFHKGKKQVATITLTNNYGDISWNSDVRLNPMRLTPYSLAYIKRILKANGMKFNEETR